MLTTSSEELATKLRLLANHGMHPRYFHQVVGINSRLASVQAAVLNVKITQLPLWTAARQENAARYSEMFTTARLNTQLALPADSAAYGHAWNQYTMRVPEGQRDELRQHLADARIGTEIYYPIPLHLQRCFRELGYHQGSLPETERAAAEVLSLPIFPELTAGEQQAVVDRIAEFYPARGRVAA